MILSLRSADELLARYAAFHRDQRNIATHLVGVPLVVLALGVLLARPAFELAGLALTPAWITFAIATGWYLTRGQFLLGLAASAATGLMVAAAQPLAAGSTAAWLGWGLGLFGLGWFIQFVGHYYEGRRPAVADDLAGLPVGPMFVTLELLAMAGGFKALMARIERLAGPTHVRDLAHPMTR
jgi:uncharacterized membrane protein YGL010W